MPSRRSVLIGAISTVALAGCSAAPGERPGGASAADGIVSGTAPDAADSVVAAAEAAPNGTQPQTALPAPPATSPTRPSLAQIQAAFGARTPRAWGLEVPGVVTRSATQSVALTFDACGGPGGTGLDERLLAALRKNAVPATLFLNARWIAANPGRSAELAADPLFELADHGSAHRPLSVNGRSAYGIQGTGSLAAVYEELLANRANLEQLAPRAGHYFRPGTAYYDDVAAEVTRAVGLVPVNFSVNGDGGATFSPAQVAGTVGTVRAGDIVISHINRPGSGTAQGYEAVLPRLLEKGVRFATLTGAGLVAA